MKNKTAVLDLSSYYPLWGRQLLAEFAAINHQYRLALAPPAFEITESVRLYGSWQAATRTIGISACMIATHSWAVTCQILKHEMAHQVCAERFQAPDAGHGPLFQKACDLLGLAAPFRRATGDLPEEIPADQPGDQHTEVGRLFIRRIGKLLALAGSANEHEAAIAMEKAGRLMARHNLQQLEAASQSPFTTHTLNTGSKRLANWQRRICAILMRFFYVKVVIASLYDPLGNTHHKTIELFGRQENVTVAEYCHTFLSRQLAALWQQNRGRINAGGIRARNSYYLGLLQGFHDRLQAREEQQAAPQAEKNTPPSCCATKELALLMTTEDRALNRFIETRFPHLRKRSGKGTVINRETYEQGRTDGRQIVLHQGVSGHSATPGLYLPHL